MSLDKTDAIDQLIQSQQLPEAYRQLVDDYLVILSEQITQRRQAQDKPLLVGINGGQGSGKSTLCLFLKALLEGQQQRVVVLSQDDFYLSRAERESLSQTVHPLLKTRGVPGTHNVPLAMSTLNSLLQGEPVQLPAFDKAEDDCLPVDQWPRATTPVDIILLEGWCVGASPQQGSELTTPVNDLEKNEDSEAIWRQYVNQSLTESYQQWFSMIDYLVMLVIPDIEAVKEWRGLQEEKLRGKASSSSKSQIISDDKIERFVQHFERLTLSQLKAMPERADVVFYLNSNHGIDYAKGLVGKTIHAIIFTDLDGTLLDHHDYSFTAAKPALDRIAQLEIPLIINSSKTSAEIIELQKQLAINQPFICENGAAVLIPDEQGYRCHSFATGHSQVVAVLNKLRDSHGYQFTGFSDGDAEAIVALTGLDLQQAQWAGQREFTEPLLWQDTPQRLEQFKQQLAENHLVAQQGGRFLSISSNIDKAQSMQWLCQYYGGKPLLIALGDSPNDAAMLNSADIAVVIKSARSDTIQIQGANKVIRTELPGPAGWQAAMDTILPTLN